MMLRTGLTPKADLKKGVLVVSLSRLSAVHARKTLLACPQVSGAFPMIISVHPHLRSPKVQ